MPLYHGGRGRRQPGASIDPGQRPNPWGDTFDEHGRSVYVYATDRREIAEAYVDAIRANGRTATLYEVEPTGEVIDTGMEIKSRHPFKIVKKIDY